jgi:hypothetical protein
MTRRGAALAAAVTLAALGGCRGGGADTAGNQADDIVISDGAGQAARQGGGDLVTLAADDSTAAAAATPMNQREAVLGILNKRNGEAREFRLKPGQAARIGDVVVRLRACDRTAPWEANQITGAFVQVDVQQVDRSFRRVFSGWLFKELPAANVVRHPIYDVWPKSCAMTFKDKGEETVAAPGAGTGAPSSAKKSPATAGTPAASPPEPSPSAAASNAT